MPSGSRASKRLRNGAPTVKGWYIQSLTHELNLLQNHLAIMDVSCLTVQQMQILRRHVRSMTDSLQLTIRQFSYPRLSQLAGTSLVERPSGKSSRKSPSP